MIAARRARMGDCAPWTPAEDRPLEPFIWMQRDTPQAVITREPSPLDRPAPPEQAPITVRADHERR